MSEPGTSSSSVTMRGDHLGGGDLTGGLAAHAVGDGEQTGAGVAGVLVALADHALVRTGGEAQGQTHAYLPVGSGYIRTVPTLSLARRGSAGSLCDYFRSSMTVLPMRIGAPSGTGVGVVSRVRSR